MPSSATFHTTWRTLFVGLFVSLSIIVLGIFFFLRGRLLMEQQLKQKLLATAAAAAMQFDGVLVDKIHGEEDLPTPLYRSMAMQLQHIVRDVPLIRFAYIMRKSDDPNRLLFVADADTLRTKEELDVNKNGVVDLDERPAYPGDEYDVTDLPVMRKNAFKGPAVDQGVTNDQWGLTISGYAPIRRWDTGEVVAILGVDMDAKDYYALSQTIFSPIAFLLVLLAATLLAIYLIYILSGRRLEQMKILEEERTGLILLTSHQLSTPLTLFKWSMETLRDRDPAEPIDSVITKHMHNLQEGISRMEKILESFRDAGKVEEGKVRFQLDFVKLHEIVQDVVHEHEKELDARRQRVELQLDTQIELHVDKKLISGVVHELLDNAKTYSPPDTTIVIRAFKKGNFAHFSVQDHGGGIPADDLPRMFEKFTRAANASQFYADGKGLGLFIAKGVVKRAGGDMWLESEEGKGTTATFTLPLANGK